jgi:predicted RNA polymerase sigma factor
MDTYKSFCLTRSKLPLGRRDQAVAAYRKALRLATNKIEQDYLRKRLEQCEKSGN